MKTLVTLASALILSTSAFAASDKAPEYYSAHFEVVGVEPMCPVARIRSGATCMGIGSIVTLRATLNCSDRLVFSEVESIRNGGAVDLHVASVVRRGDNRIRCIRANTVQTKVNVPVNSVNYNVINANIDSH